MKTEHLHLSGFSRIFRNAGTLCFAALFTLLLSLAPVVRAQDTGYISGTVTDKTGSAVVGAEVVVTLAGGSLTRTTTTNSDGAYVVAGLPGGAYDIAVTAKGFEKYQVKGVKLDVAEKIRVDVELTVGAMAQVVEVQGENVAQVETTSSDLTSTISGKQVNQLELNGRNFTQLVTLAPGVVSQTGQDEGTVGVYGSVLYAINGGRVEYNNWEIDGGDNMDNGSNGTLNVYPNLEALAEFKVLTSNYGAQYGRNGSGTVEVETKSGGSAFHGSAFEYARNDIFNAKSWAEGATPLAKKASYKKHDFGYTVGGPVYIPNHYNSDKKKTFFFFSEEWRREKNPFTILQDVPSDAERGGNFGDVCPTIPTGQTTTSFYRDPTVAPTGTTVFPDCPATGSGPTANTFQTFPGNNTGTPGAVATALNGIIPHSNTTNGLLSNGNPIPAVSQTVSLPTTWREELVRIDHNITNNYRLTFRYIHDSWQTTTQNALWGNGSSFVNINTGFVGPGTSFVARLNANVSPTLLNEFVASYTADHIFLTAINNPPVPSPFPMGVLFNNGLGGKLPAISLSSNAAYGGSLTSDTGYFPWNNANPTYTLRDNVTKIIGVHTLQFGAYVALAQKNEQNSPYIQGILTFNSGAPISTGNAFADLLIGNVAQYQQTNSQLKYYNRYKIVEPYFQDDWRLTKRLTLNLGLRLSLYGTYRERYQQAFNLEPASTAFKTANEPALFNNPSNSSDPKNGSLVGGNPFNGIVQCGGAGGTSSVPAPVLTAFPLASVGPSSEPGCLKGHLFNPAPRIGFAFDPKGNGRMAIRGGYGIFYEHTNGNEGNTESLEGSAPLVLTESVFNVTGYNNIGAGGGLLFPLGGFTAVPTKAIWPYVQQWHLDVQKELPSHIVLTTSYVGSKGTHLTLLSNGNQLVPFTGTNPFAPGQPITSADCSSFTTNANGVPTAATLGNGTPVPAAAVPNLWVACNNSANALRPLLGYGSISQLQDMANSTYHALQVSARRTVGDLTLSLAYTYSHSIDDSSDRYDSTFVNTYNLAANRGSSNFDVRHNLAISYVYGLPLFKGAGLAHTILGGWQVSGITIAQTGVPVNVTNGTNFTDNAGVGNAASGGGSGQSRPNLVGDPRAGITQTEFPDVRGPLFYNPAAFALPTGLTFGNVGRNTLTMPGRLNFDFGTFKRFPIGERAGFEFRWETFNIFNHTQYNAISTNTQSAGTAANSALNTTNPGANLDSSAFMHLTGTHGPRRMQFGLRLYF